MEIKKETFWICNVSIKRPSTTTLVTTSVCAIRPKCGSATPPPSNAEEKSEKKALRPSPSLVPIRRARARARAVSRSAGLLPPQALLHSTAASSASVGKMPVYSIRGVNVDFPFDAYDCQITYMDRVIESLQQVTRVPRSSNPAC